MTEPKLWNENHKQFTTQLQQCKQQINQERSGINFWCLITKEMVKVLSSWDSVTLGFFSSFLVWDLLILFSESHAIFIPIQSAIFLDQNLYLHDFKAHSHPRHFGNCFAKKNSAASFVNYWPTNGFSLWRQSPAAFSPSLLFEHFISRGAVSVFLGINNFLLWDKERGMAHPFLLVERVVSWMDLSQKWFSHCVGVSQWTSGFTYLTVFVEHLLCARYYRSAGIQW